MRCPLGRCFGAVGAKAHAPPQTGDVLANQPPEVTLELLPHKGVKDGANAAVGVGDILADVERIVQTL